MVRRLATKLPPPDQRRPRRATKLPPPEQRSDRVTQPASQQPTQQFPSARPERPRAVGLRQQTGRASSRVVSDVLEAYDMIPMASTRVWMAGYNAETQTIRVRFVDGTPWEYREVPPDVWQAFKTSESPGYFIYSVLDQYPYGRGNF